MPRLLLRSAITFFFCQRYTRNMRDPLKNCVLLSQRNPAPQQYLIQHVERAGPCLPMQSLQPAGVRLEQALLGWRRRSRFSDAACRPFAQAPRCGPLGFWPDFPGAFSLCVVCVVQHAVSCRTCVAMGGLGRLRGCGLACQRETPVAGPVLAVNRQTTVLARVHFRRVSRSRTASIYASFREQV